MPNTPKITIVKRFTYRNAPEEFSNSYHFSGTVPSDAAGWKTLADAIITAERPTVIADIKFVRAYGYVAGTIASVAQIDYTQAPNTLLSGTKTITAQIAPGDAAATVRWLTPDTNSRGKKIYLRKYFHGVEVQAGTSDAACDMVNPAQKALWLTFANKMIDGTLPGGFTYCGPQGAVASAPAVAQFVTTRTLKRRGKRPPT